MVNNNLKDDDKPMDSVPALSYKTEQERAFHISKAAEQQEHTRPNGENIEATAVYGTEDNGVINIPLQYDPQALTELDLWSSSFYPISLHGLCYDLKLKRLSDKTTLVLSNTRELDRVPSTK